MSKDTLLAIIAFPLVFLPALLTSLLCDIIFRPSVWWGFHLSYAVSCFVALGVLWFTLKYAGLEFEDIGLRNFRLSHLAWAFLFFLVAGAIWNGLSAFLATIDLKTSWGSEIHFTQPYEVVIIFVYAVIAAPLAEEFLFRGFFITLVGRLINPWIAGVISILLFSIYHIMGFGLVGGLLILFWTLWPTLLFLWKKSLYPGLIMHAMNNLFAYVILGLLASYYLPR